MRQPHGVVLAPKHGAAGFEITDAAVGELIGEDIVRHRNVRACVCALQSRQMKPTSGSELPWPQAPHFIMLPGLS